MKKRVLCIIAAVVFCLAVPVPALANSAGLPYLTILVETPCRAGAVPYRGK